MLVSVCTHGNVLVVRRLKAYEVYHMDLMGMEKTSKKVSKELSKTKEIVLAVLKESDRARNEDQWLILCCLQRMGQDIKVEFDGNLRKTVIIWKIVDAHDITSFETITRCRREIQNNQGLYLPTDPDVAAKRGIREDAFREYYARR